MAAPTISLVHLPPTPAGPESRNEDSWRRWLARVLGDDDDRYRHSLGVLERARDLTSAPPVWLDELDAERLSLAGLLHDVGRSVAIDDREPHALVGARLLSAAGLDDVAALVAHHSGARFELAARNLAYPSQWETPDRRLVAILTFLDHTTSRTGQPITAHERRSDLVERYGSASMKVVTFDLAGADAALGRSLVEDVRV